MIRSLYNAASCLNANVSYLDALANNMANINTTGYKRQNVSFESLVRRSISASGRPVAPAGGTGDRDAALGCGVRVVSIVHSFEQGTLVQTGRNLDLAIDGEGFFILETPEGEFRYTRDGNFHVNSEGKLVGPGGYILWPGVELPAGWSEISVDASGTVTVLDGSGTRKEVGTISLARFTNPSGLSATGFNLFVETEASGARKVGKPAEEGFGVIKQYHLERANVELDFEIARVIEAQRSYELNLRTVMTADEMWSLANNLYR